MNEQQLKELENRITELTIKSLNAEKELDNAQKQYIEASKIYRETLDKFDDLENKLKEAVTDKKIAELDIEKAIENKDIPYIIIYIRGLIQEVQKQTTYQIFVELDNIIKGHGSTEITAYTQRRIFFKLNDYEELKKKFKVD